MAGAATDTSVVVNVDDQLWGLDPDTGANRWVVDLPVPEGAYNQAIVGLATDGTVVVTQDSGSNTWISSAIDATDGRVL